MVKHLTLTKSVYLFISVFKIYFFNSHKGNVQIHGGPENRLLTYFPGKFKWIENII